MSSSFFPSKVCVSQDSLLATAKYTKRDTYMEKDKWSAIKMCQDRSMLRVEIENFYEHGKFDNATPTPQMHLQMPSLQQDL